MEGIETPVEAPVEAPVDAPAPTIYFGGDGTLNEGWQSTLPEEYRDEPSLKSVKDAKILAKMFVDTKKMVGKDTIAIPKDTSPKDEWSRYYEAGGRPATPEDYNLSAPEGFPEDIRTMVFPEERIGKWQKMFFEGGVSKKAADAFITEFAKDQIADYQRTQQAEEQAKNQLISELATEYGAAFDQKMHMGDIAIEEGTGGDPDMKEALAYLRKDANAIRMLVTLGEKFAEGKAPSYSAIPTPGDYQQQIDELMASPVLIDPQSTPVMRKKITDKIMALRKLQKPE